MVTFSCPPYTVQLREGFPRMIAPGLPGPQIILVDDSPTAPTSCHRVEVLQDRQILTEAQLQCSKGETGVHEHAAVVADDTLFIACGAYISALQLPDLQLRWSTQVDDSTCFGVYHNAAHHCLITHGERCIARLNFDGSLVWQAEGSACFTGSFATQGDVVAVADDRGHRHLFDVTRGTPLNPAAA